MLLNKEDFKFSNFVTLSSEIIRGMEDFFSRFCDCRINTSDNVIKIRTSKGLLDFSVLSDVKAEYHRVSGASKMELYVIVRGSFFENDDFFEHKGAGGKLNTDSVSRDLSNYLETRGATLEPLCMAGGELRDIREVSRELVWLAIKNHERDEIPSCLDLLKKDRENETKRFKRFLSGEINRTRAFFV